MPGPRAKAGVTAAGRTEGGREGERVKGVKEETEHFCADMDRQGNVERER